MSYDIRPASLHELHLCVPFGEAFHKEMQLPGEFVGQIFVESWIAILATIPSAILLLFKDETLIGGIGGIVSPDLNDGRLRAQEFFWFVDKAHRGGSGAIRLVDAFEDWAASKGAVEVDMVHLLTVDTNEQPNFEKFYTHRGYDKLEVHFRKPLGRKKV